MFSKKKTPAELQREQKRNLRGAQRDLDRDKRNLEQQEQKIEAEIRKYAKMGNQSACKTLAKQLIRLRAQKNKLTQTSATVSAVGFRATTMQSTVKMAQAMGGAAQAMKVTNDQMSVQDLQKTMQSFERESMQMDMKEEMMNDTLDSMMEEEGDEEESAAIMGQVLDEIGIDLSGKMVSVPAQGVPQAAPAVPQYDPAVDDDLSARIASLRGV